MAANGAPTPDDWRLIQQVINWIRSFKIEGPAGLVTFRNSLSTGAACRIDFPKPPEPPKNIEVAVATINSISPDGDTRLVLAQFVTGPEFPVVRVSHHVAGDKIYIYRAMNAAAYALETYMGEKVVWRELGCPDQGFAFVGADATRDGSKYRWSYAIYPAVKTSAGFDGFETPDPMGGAGLTAYCAQEMTNGATGVLGCGVNLATLPDGWDVYQVPAGSLVPYWFVQVGSGFEIIFSGSNRVDGECP